MRLIEKIKKAPFFAYKFLTNFRLKELFLIYNEVKRSDFLLSVYARTHKVPREVTVVALGKKEINNFLDVVSYRDKCVQGDIYLWKYNDKQYYATYNQFCGLLSEYLNNEFDRIYSNDWENKVVIDVGGFVGDSALHFFKNGAKEVIIYEPLNINVKALKFNLEKYRNKFSVYEKALADQEGWITLSSFAPEGDLGFGCSKGEYEVRCPSTTFLNIIKNKLNVDVIKIDCEGAEEFLLDVANNYIQSIPYWIVETHRKDIYEKIQVKFNQCGFEKRKEFALNPDVDLLHFEFVQK